MEAKHMNNLDYDKLKIGQWLETTEDMVIEECKSNTICRIRIFLKRRSYVKYLGEVGWSLCLEFNNIAYWTLDADARAFFSIVSPNTAKTLKVLYEG